MIHHIAATGSTNADILALVGGESWLEGDWLVAARQGAGRGRLGRDWHDGAGNFMGSTLVTLRSGDPPAPSLALVAGLAVADAVDAVLAGAARPVLKWPNDVLIGAAKIAGVLLERAADAVVVGVGVNLAHAPAVPGRETAAVADFALAPSPADFARRLSECFTKAVDDWRTGGLASTIARWLAAAHPVGTPLVVFDGVGARVNGCFAGLDASGALRLARGDGTVAMIHAGDVAYG